MKFITRDNFKVEISKLYQVNVYSGIMLGDLEIVNESIISNLKQNFVPMNLRDFPLFPLRIEKFRNKLFEKLPNVVSIAFLKTEYNKPKEGYFFSALLVLWFQDDYFEKPSNDIIQAIENIEWKKCSIEREFN